MQFSYIMTSFEYLHTSFLPCYGTLKVLEVFVTRARMVGGSRIYTQCLQKGKYYITINMVHLVPRALTMPLQIEFFTSGDCKICFFITCIAKS